MDGSDLGLVCRLVRQDGCCTTLTTETISRQLILVTDILVLELDG